MKRLISVIMVLCLLSSGLAMAESGTSYFDDVMEKAQEKQQAPDTKLTLPLTFNTFYERYEYMCGILNAEWDTNNVESLDSSDGGQSVGFNIDNLIIWADNTEQHNVTAVLSYVSEHHSKTTNNATARQVALVATLGYGLPASDNEIKTMKSNILDELIDTAFSTAILSDTCPSWEAYLDSDIADYTYELLDGAVWLKAVIKQA